MDICVAYQASDSGLDLGAMREAPQGALPPRQCQSQRELFCPTRSRRLREDWNCELPLDYNQVLLWEMPTDGGWRLVRARCRRGGRRLSPHSEDSAGHHRRRRPRPRGPNAFAALDEPEPQNAMDHQEMMH